jgi:hypothetical protein
MDRKDVVRAAELQYDPAEMRVRVLATVDALGVSLDA